MRFIRPAIVATFAFSAGCSSSGGSSVPVVTGIDGNRTVSSLASGELTQWCVDLGAFYAQNLTADQIKADICVGQIRSGYAYAPPGSLLICQQSYENCVSNLFNQTLGPDCTQIQYQSKSCSAKVADVNRCYQDGLGAAVTQAAIGRGVCDSIGADAGLSTVPKPSASCQALPKGCAFFGGPT